MTTEAEPSSRSTGQVFNLPNQLTSLRLLLSVVMFCTIACEWYLASLILFLVAAGTDWLDGYFARKYGLVTTLGRILDPFADKVIICGTFIFLLTVPQMREVPFGLRAWMVVVIVGRELLVTTIRGFMEQQGHDFSAKMPGKIKMFLQCIAAVVCLAYLHWFGDSAGQSAAGWPAWLVVASVWSAVVLTVYSGVGYIFAAVRMLRQ